MAAVYYEVEFDGASGALLLKQISSIPLPPEAVELGKRFRALFDRIRLRVPPTPGRATYLGNLVVEVRAALEDGDLPRGENALAEFAQHDLSIRYFRASIDANGDVHVSATPWLEVPMPPEVRSFLDRIENACRKIGLLVTKVDVRARHFAALQSHARHGLEEGQIGNATLALSHFEAQFVAEEGPAIRKNHLTATLSTALGILGGLGALGLLLWLAQAYFPNPTLLVLSNLLVKPVLPLAVGICLGVVFFAFIRNLALTFDSLGNFDAAHLSPWLRFTLVGVITALLCILMSAGLIKLEINDLKLYEYLTNNYAALIVGILCGYSDTAITQLLTGVLDRKPAP